MTEERLFKWSSKLLCICLYLGLNPRPLCSRASVLPTRPQCQILRRQVFSRSTHIFRLVCIRLHRTVLELYAINTHLPIGGGGVLNLHRVGILYIILYREGVVEL